jgi:hypothetical protein
VRHGGAGNRVSRRNWDYLTHIQRPESLPHSMRRRLRLPCSLTPAPTNHAAAAPPTLLSSSHASPPPPLTLFRRSGRCRSIIAGTPWRRHQARRLGRSPLLWPLDHRRHRCPVRRCTPVEIGRP